MSRTGRCHVRHLSPPRTTSEKKNGQIRWPCGWKPSMVWTPSKAMISFVAKKAILSSRSSYIRHWRSSSLWNRNHSHLCTNLVATLACLKVNDFPHFGRNVKVPYDVSQKLLPLWRFSNRRTNLPEKVGDTVNYSRQINAIGRAICQSKHNRLLIGRVNTVSCFDWLVLRWHRCLGNTKKNSIHNSVSAETRLIYLQRGV